MPKRKRKLGLTWTPAVSRAFKEALPLLGGMAVANVLASKLAPKGMRRLRDPLYDTAPATSGQIRSIEEKLQAIDAQLGLLLRVLTLDPKAKLPPAFKMTWAIGRKPRNLTPVGMFLRAILSGVPFSVNGIVYRPVRRKNGKG